MAPKLLMQRKLTQTFKASIHTREIPKSIPNSKIPRFQSFSSIFNTKPLNLEFNEKLQKSSKSTILFKKPDFKINKQSDAIDQISLKSAQRFWKALEEIEKEGLLEKRLNSKEWLSRMMIIALTSSTLFLNSLPSEAVAEMTENAVKEAGAQATSLESIKILPGVNIVEGTILILPFLLYFVFTVYRTNFNRNAKFGDFMLLIVSSLIFGNIFTMLLFKIRLF